MDKIKVITTFSGYDSQCMALDRLKEHHPDFDYELMRWCNNRFIFAQCPRFEDYGKKKVRGCDDNQQLLFGDRI